MVADTQTWFELAHPEDILHDVVMAWQNGRTGTVVALREITPDRKYVVETFPENYHDDVKPIDVVARVHSVRSNAEARARRYMESND